MREREREREGMVEVEQRREKERDFQTFTIHFVPFTSHKYTHSLNDFDYYLLRFGFDLWLFTITKVPTYNNIFARKLSLLLLLLLLVLLLHVYLGS